MDKTIEILRQYPYIGDDIRKAQAKLNMFINLKHEAENPLKAQTLSHEPHSTGTSDQTLSTVEKIMDRYQVEIDKYAAKINELLDLKKWLDKAFSELTDNERRILYMLYEDNQSYRTIGRIYKCGRYQAQKLAEEARVKIKRIIS